MDPTSPEESTPWDPITGRVRPHVSFKRSTCSPSSLQRTGSPQIHRPPSGAGSANKAVRQLAHRKAARAVALVDGSEAPEPTATESSVAYDIINDSSGHNVDADAQTMMGIEVRERFHDMQTAFLNMDLNFDGKITKDELIRACRKWNIPASEAERVMNCADVDQSGYLDFDEFAKRFDPSLTVKPEDAEILRLYQQGVMDEELPLKLAGVYHGTSTAEPLVDEAANLRSDNGDLRGRLARCMQRVQDLGDALDQTRAHNAALEKSLGDSQANVADLLRTVAGLKDDLHRTKEGELAALERAAAAERQLKTSRDLDAELERRKLEQDLELAKRYREQDLDAELERRKLEQDLELAKRQRDQDKREAELELERLRRKRDLEAASNTRPAVKTDSDGSGTRPAAKIDCDESRTVFIYGRDGCEKTKAMQSALKKAKIPFQMRNFDKDKRYMDCMKKSGYDNGSVYAPVVCLGDKAWWYNPAETQMVPWPQAVACELRHDLGLNDVPLPVRVGADIDTEIYERFVSMQDAFLKLDVDKDGIITKNELRNRCTEWHIPVSEADRVIAEAGSEFDNALDFDEFAKRFGGHRDWGSRGVLRGLAPPPDRHSKRGRTR